MRSMNNGTVAQVDLLDAMHGNGICVLAVPLMAHNSV